MSVHGIERLTVEMEGERHDKQRWQAVAMTLCPGLTPMEYESMWEDYKAAKGVWLREQNDGV